MFKGPCIASQDREATDSSMRTNEKIPEYIVFHTTTAAVLQKGFPR